MVGGVPARPSHHIVREDIVSNLKRIDLFQLKYADTKFLMFWAQKLIFEKQHMI